MKIKKNNAVIKIFLVSSTIIIGILCYLFFVGIDINLPTSQAELTGKTKKEVWQIAFDKAQRDPWGEVAIMIKLQNSNGYWNYSYKTLDEALKDERVMNCDHWLLFHTRIPFRIDSKHKYFKIKFVDGKASDVEEGYWSEF